MPQTNSDLQNDPALDIVEPDFDDMSIADPANTGIKGGSVSKDARDPRQAPISLVDFLWKHRDD